MLNLISSVSGGTTLNVDNDGNPGLTIPRSPDGLIEISSPTVQAWSEEVAEELTLKGHVTLRLYLATAGFADGFGEVIVGLIECQNPSSVCTTIGAGRGGFSQTSFGSDFGRIDIYLGDIDQTVEPGQYLLVTVAVPESSPHDLWLEFGSPTYPSELRVN